MVIDGRGEGASKIMVLDEKKSILVFNVLILKGIHTHYQTIDYVSNRYFRILLKPQII